MRGVGSLGLLFLLIFLGAVPALADEPPPDSTEARLVTTFVSEGDPNRRAQAGLDLARNYPANFVTSVDRVIDAGREGDAEVLATLAVRVGPRHLRLLVVWAVSELEGGKELFLDKIDFDHPFESKAAIEALGFLGDASAVESLLTYARDRHDQIAIQAARALARLGRSRDAQRIADALVECESVHVREHLIWAAVDVAKGGDKVKKLISRYSRRPGVLGERARDTVEYLADDPPPPQQYKVKLSTVRKLFSPNGEVQPPKIKGLTEPVAKVRSVLEGMKKDLPGYYHLLCTAVKEVRTSNDSLVLDVGKRSVNLRPSRIEKWDREVLYSYYLIQYSTILFLGMMGDPDEGHRGWEEGIMEGWRFAIESGKLGVTKDPDQFMQGILDDPPW